MTNAQILGDKLYRLRKDKGISQEELAYKLNVSRQAISKWERGEALPDTDNLISLAKLYEVSLDELVGNDVESYQPVIAPTASVDVDEDERDYQDDDELPPRRNTHWQKGQVYPCFVRVAIRYCCNSGIHPLGMFGQWLGHWLDVVPNCACVLLNC